jgi:hypothetical protein
VTLPACYETRLSNGPVGFTPPPPRPN